MSVQSSNMFVRDQVLARLGQYHREHQASGGVQGMTTVEASTMARELNVPVSELLAGRDQVMAAHAEASDRAATNSRRLREAGASPWVGMTNPGASKSPVMLMHANRGNLSSALGDWHPEVPLSQRKKGPTTVLPVPFFEFYHAACRNGGVKHDEAMALVNVARQDLTFRFYLSRYVVNSSANFTPEGLQAAREGLKQLKDGLVQTDDFSELLEAEFQKKTISLPMAKSLWALGAGDPFKEFQLSKIAKEYKWKFAPGADDYLLAQALKRTDGGDPVVEPTKPTDPTNPTDPTKPTDPTSPDGPGGTPTPVFQRALGLAQALGSDGSINQNDIRAVMDAIFTRLVKADAAELRTAQATVRSVLEKHSDALTSGRQRALRDLLAVDPTSPHALGQMLDLGLGGLDQGHAQLVLDKLSEQGSVSNQVLARMLVGLRLDDSARSLLKTRLSNAIQSFPELQDLDRVAANPACFTTLSAERQNSPEFVAAGLRLNPALRDHLPRPISNPAMLEALLRVDGEILFLATPELQDEPRMVTLALQTTPNIVSRFTDAQKCRPVVVETLFASGSGYLLAGIPNLPELSHALALATVKRSLYGRDYGSLAESQRGNHEIALAAVKRLASNMGKAPPALKADPQFMAKAIAVNPKSVLYADPSMLSQHPELCIAAYGAMDDQVPSEYFGNRDVVRVWLQRASPACANIDPQLLNDVEFLAQAFAPYPLMLDRVKLDSAVRSRLLSAHPELATALKEQQDTLRRLGIEHPERIGGGGPVLAEIIANRTQPRRSGDNRPASAYLMAKKDGSEALGQNSIAELCRGQRVLYFEINNQDDLFDVLDEIIRRGEPVDPLVIMGHGRPTAIGFGEPRNATNPMDAMRRAEEGEYNVSDLPLLGNR